MAQCTFSNAGYWIGFVTFKEREAIADGRSSVCTGNAEVIHLFCVLIASGFERERNFVFFQASKIGSWIR